MHSKNKHNAKYTLSYQKNKLYYVTDFLDQFLRNYIRKPPLGLIT